MKILYAIFISTTVLTYCTLQYLLPFQEELAHKQAKESQKSQWVSAADACSRITQTSVTTSMDATGAVYCISQAGKLLATIAQEETQNNHRKKP